jgi:uncharacterized protein (DUF2141 family)
MALSNFCDSQTLHIHVTGIRNTTGNIRFAFYTNAKSFDDEKPLFVRTVSKTTLSKSAYVVSFNDIKSGVYGIALLDDENKNEKMDYGLVLPKEGFGFSDFYLSGLKRPKFEDFDFVLKQEQKTVEMKLRYL